MKHEITNLMTKRTITASLKKIIKNKSLDKITVREIIEDCGVNRKTFYYHFDNIYDLVKWIFEEEAINIVKQYDLIVDYHDAIQFILDYVEDNKLICNCVFDVIGRDELKKFFQKDFIYIFNNIVDQLSEGKKVSEEYKVFLVNFYTESLASLLINWIRNKEKYDKQKMIQYVSLTLFGSIEYNLAKAENEL